MPMNDNTIIRLVEVRKSFAGNEVLKGVSLDVEAGKTTIIVGQSGQGKSVLLKHILGLIRPDAGQVIVDAVDVSRAKGKKLKEVRTKFGVLFQGAALLDSLDVLENVALPLRQRTKLKDAEIRRRVIEKLQLVGMADQLDKYPAQLSGGMKKRVGLARALQLEPQIVLFDEPTTGLDPVKVKDMYKLFFETQKLLKYTAVIVSHDIPKIFNLSDMVAVMHDGIILTHCSYEDIQRSENDVVKTLINDTMGSIYSSDQVEQ
ncbi:MAG: ATP-binding cassette domain-containing protein [Deltaproteobacteria bacterium]|nr:ATP-binding cassette domain-containing protein [Deltaproteobacteria bacterium]